MTDEKAQIDRSKLDAAINFKEQANEAYMKRDYINAIKFYHLSLLSAKAISLLNIGVQSLLSTSLEGASASEEEWMINKKKKTAGGILKMEAEDIISKCYNNLAACLLSEPERTKEDYLRAVEYCNKVLEFDKNNQKAFFRKGQAFIRVANYEKAIIELEKCEGNSKARELIYDCRMKLAEEKKRRDEKLRANFAKARAVAAAKEKLNESTKV